jgi:hypothetical protein
MFPNVRLTVVAILAAIAGIGCGLGLFATFRVNHEPLARLAEGSPPLQLAFHNRALDSDARAPLEARLPVNGAPKVISVPVIIATPSSAPSPATSPAAEQASADLAIAGDSSVQQESAGAAVEDKSNTASIAIAVPAEQSSVPPEAPDLSETVAAVADQQPAASPASAPAARQTAAINAAAEDQQPAAKPTKSGDSKAAEPAARATRTPPTRRAAKTVRARRTVATVAARPTYQYPQATYSQPTYSQPTYSWADGTAQAAQPVKRVQIKRRHTAKKTIPAAQSNPAAVTAGLSGTQ